MTDALTTKDRIAQVSLELFAQRGYHAVSIRDICKEVGVKESTVCYHYENKQAIWDALINQIDQLIGARTSLFDHAFEGIDQYIPFWDELPSDTWTEIEDASLPFFEDDLVLLCSRVQRGHAPG